MDHVDDQAGSATGNSEVKPACAQPQSIAYSVLHRREEGRGTMAIFVRSPTLLQKQNSRRGKEWGARLQVPEVLPNEDLPRLCGPPHIADQDTTRYQIVPLVSLA